MLSEYTSSANLPALRQQPVPAVTPTGTLATIMQRIEETIAAETMAIRGNPRFDIKASNGRKSRALYELSKALKAEGGARVEHQPAIGRLKVLLTANESAIRAHLSAVGEVAAIIQNAIQSAETDGTYSSQEFGRA